MTLLRECGLMMHSALERRRAFSRRQGRGVAAKIAGGGVSQRALGLPGQPPPLIKLLIQIARYFRNDALERLLGSPKI